MNVVRQRFHVRELVIGLDDARGVALAFPGVVDIDVEVAGVPHAGGDEGIGGFADRLVGDLARKVVPTIPAHGWCGAQSRRGAPLLGRGGGWEAPGAGDQEQSGGETQRKG